MAKFRDNQGREWPVELDGLLLDQIRRETTIDLSDFSGAGFSRLETDYASLVKVLVVVCSDQMQAVQLAARQFSKSMTGDCLPKAFAALLDAASFFFPKDHWSKTLSYLDQSRTAKAKLMELAPLMHQLNDPNFPAILKDGITAALGEMIEHIDLQKLAGGKSASGQDGTPSKNATDEPANAASAHAA